MDAGILTEDGNIAVMARSDDVINVAGHRLSTGALEEVLHVFCQITIIYGLHISNVKTTPVYGFHLSRLRAWTWDVTGVKFRLLFEPSDICVATGTGRG